jgi:hypothetical protein
MVEALLRKRFRLPFRCRREVNRAPKAADEHYPQTDFLRCHCSRRNCNAKGVLAKSRAGLSNDIGVIEMVNSRLTA